MHILVTDHLTCPRCGPDHGLIVLADRISDRRIQQGELGCANCRERFPIDRGLADLRAGEPLSPAEPSGTLTASERAYRTAALLGVGHAPGTVLLLGASDALAEEVGGLLPNAEVVVGGGAGERDEATGRRLLLGDRLPFRSGSMRAVAIVAAAAEPILGEAARVLARGGHLVLDPAPSGGAASLAALGLEVRLEQDGVAVASAS